VASTVDVEKQALLHDCRSSAQAGEVQHHEWYCLHRRESAFMSVFVGWCGLAINSSNLISVAACSLFNFILADRIVFDKPIQTNYAE
jgi:hypothetical protein